MSTNYKKKLPPSKKIRYRYHGRECSLCGGELKQKSTGNRNLTNLEYKAALSIQICGCTNEACPNASARLKPVEYLNQIVPESGYGIDVYALIGHLRYSCHQTVSEIHRYLLENYPHIEIGERHVENIIKDLSLCIEQSGRNASALRHYFTVRGQSSLQLSIDGVQPEQGHSILYVVREVISGKLLFAHYSTHSDAVSIREEVLSPLKSTLDEVGLPIGGWIADKEAALGKSVQAVFPKVPFQHCQSHFLGAMKKPLTEADTVLGKSVKKNFGKLRPIERAVQQAAKDEEINDIQKDCLMNICGMIRSWQSRSLAHKHRLKGVELYEAMLNIKDTVTALQAKQDHSILQQLHRCLSDSVAGLQTDYEALKHGQTILTKLGDLLYGEQDEKGNRDTQTHKEKYSSTQIKRKVEALLRQSQAKYKTHSSPMRGYLRHFKLTYQNWKQYLFTCYDHPQIPNDNNTLELSHSRVKRQHRRITGQRNTARYLKIHGQQAIHTLEYATTGASQNVFKEVLQRTDYTQLKKQKKQQRQKSKQRGSLLPTPKALKKLKDKVIAVWEKL